MDVKLLNGLNYINSLIKKKLFKIFVYINSLHFLSIMLALIF